jgi:hypothetical protein
MNTSGVKIGELRYKAFGETRYTSGATPTKRQYRAAQRSIPAGDTGQINDTEIGLYFYNARFNVLRKLQLWSILLFLSIFFSMVSCQSQSNSTEVVSCQNQSDSTEYEQLFQDLIGNEISLNSEISLERLATNLDSQGGAVIVIYNHSGEDAIFPIDTRPRFFWKDVPNITWLEITKETGFRMVGTRIIPAGFEKLPKGNISEYAFMVEMDDFQQFVPDDCTRIYIEGTTAITGKKVGAYIDIKLTKKNP